MSTVTVVIPTLHHRHQSLQAALESIAAQTYQDFTVFVMPDGPDPDLLQVLFWSEIPAVRAMYRAGKVEVIPLGQVWHIYGAPQRLIAGYLARTEFIAYLDDDNLWLPEHLEVLRAAIGDHSFAYAMQQRPEGPSFDGDARRYKIDTSAILHRTDALRITQWPVDNVHIADGLFIERLIAGGATYAFVPKVTSIYSGAHIGDGMTPVHL